MEKYTPFPLGEFSRLGAVYIPSRLADCLCCRAAGVRSPPTGVVPENLKGESDSADPDIGTPTLTLTDTMEKDLRADEESDESSDINEEIQRTLLASCEKAFRNGVTSADIYDTLKLMGEKADADVYDDHQGKMTYLTPSFLYFRNYFVKIVELFRRLIWGIFLTTVTTIGIFFALTYFLNMNFWPLTELDETRCLLPTHPILQELTRPITNCSICEQFRKNGTPVIEFRSNPSADAFRTVAYSSKPIIIRNNTATGMSRNFNFEQLKSLFHSEPGGMKSVADECQFLPFKSSFKDLSEVFETVTSNVGSDSVSPWYIGWSNCHPGIQEKLRELFPRPSYLPSDSENSVIDWIFVGLPGYGAAMHLDFVRRPSWQAQLSGVKKWRLKPPPECESICGDGDISFTLSPGDLLFLDTNSWYHETLILGDDVSISIGSEKDTQSSFASGRVNYSIFSKFFGASKFNFLGMAHPCRCPDCPGRVQDKTSDSADVDDELLNKFEHIRRVAEGTSEVRLNGGGGCKCQAEKENSDESKVDVLGAVAFFESEIAKESGGAAYSRMRFKDLSSKSDLRRKSRSGVGSGSCGCDVKK